MADIALPTELLIDGAFVAGEGEAEKVLNPATGEVLVRAARSLDRAGAQGGVGRAPRVRRLERDHADGALAPAAEAGRRASNRAPRSSRGSNR